MGQKAWNKGGVDHLSKEVRQLVNLKVSKALKGRSAFWAIGNKNRLGKKHSEETKRKISIAHKGMPNTSKGKKRPEYTGERSWKWIKDRSQLARTRNIRGDSGESVIWTRKVKNRDNWKCKKANNDCVGILEAHHILTVKDFPELRYDINNGITLCKYHHPRKRMEAKRLVPFLQRLIINTH